MTTKAKDAIVATEKFRNVAKFDVTVAVTELAAQFGLDLTLPQGARLDRAAQNLSRSVQYMLASGLDLLSIRSECEHGDFMELLESRGFGKDMAYRAITYAQFAVSLPETERNKVLALPKTKVLALATADPEVLQDLFEDEEKFEELAALSVRDMRVAIRTANAKVSDLSTQNETLERERDRLKEELRQVREGRVKTGGPVPIVVQDIRLECAALHKKAGMSIEDIGRLATEHLANGAAEDSEWNVPVARHLYASLASLQTMASGLMAQLRDGYGAALDGDKSVLDNFSPEEATRCALEYQVLISEHDHEKRAREWEREMERPRSVGRPKKQPGKPKG